MEQSANLQLPYIMPSQAQKHVTHNEAIRTLDALVQLTVLDRNLSAPPALPADGDRYLVAAGGTDAWTGKDGKLAAWQDGTWAFLTPKAGWLLWVADEHRLISFEGVTWIDAAVHSVNPAPLMGVNATADAANRLVVKSPASLFDEETGDHKLKINKAAAGDTASLVFQSAYSGRAEFGLAGDDDWHVKVSADGAVWTEALRVDRSTGRVRLPASLPLSDENQVVTRRHVREKLTANRTFYVRSDGSDGNNGMADSSGGAFLTLQHAFNTCLALDFNGFTVTLSATLGTTLEGVSINAPWIGGNLVITIGSGVILTPTTDAISVAAMGGKLTINGSGKLTAASGRNCILTTTPGLIEFSSIEFGAAPSGNHIAARASGANVAVVGNYSISGGAGTHVLMYFGANFQCISRTVTIAGTPAFTAYAQIQYAANARISGNTFSGSATGKRYDLLRNSMLATIGATLPGNASGTADASSYVD